MTHAEVASVIKKARLDAGLTQEQLADKLGTVKQSVYRMEQRAPVSLRMLNEIAKATGHTLFLDLITKKPSTKGGQ